VNARPRLHRRVGPLAVATAACLLGAFGGRPAGACRCQEMLVKDAYRWADMVVLARVQAIDAADGDRWRATVAVTRAWKAPSPATMSFVTGEDCAYTVAIGEEHLLFLKRDESGSYGTVRCRGSRLVSRARDSLGWLTRHGRPEAVRASGGMQR
jgi:hypothetical protein